MADTVPFDDDVPPPLEDMSELLKQVDIIKDVRQTKQQNVPAKTAVKQNTSSPVQGERAVNKQTNKSPKNEETQAEKRKTIQVPSPAKSNCGSFGGMKKGFLFGGGGGQKKKQQASPVRDAEKDMPFIKPNTTLEKERELPEVQQAMQAGQQFLKNKDWVTEDLLTKIMKSKTLAKRFGDPSFMTAITEFQTNPTAAMTKYQDNSEMQAFLKEFCGLMGEHFSAMGDKLTAPQASPQPDVQIHSADQADLKVRSSTNPNQATAAEEERMQQILADPEIRDILMDPRIQKLFEVLRSDPDKAQSALQKADPGLQSSIRKLVEAGLLQVQR